MRSLAGKNRDKWETVGFSSGLEGIRTRGGEWSLCSQKVLMKREKGNMLFRIGAADWGKQAG